MTTRAKERAVVLLREVKRRCYDDLPLDLWRKIESFLAAARRRK